MVMEHRFTSGSLKLAGHLALPPQRSPAGVPGVIICHGFPTSSGGALEAARTYPELADRIAKELGWVALAFCFRGAGESNGNFSLGGWLTDVHAALAHLRSLEGVSGTWIAGFGTGGALSICAAATDPRVRGVAALGAPADFDDWAGQPRQLLDHARRMRLITDARYPESFDTWARELRAIRAVQCVTEVAPRPLLVVHGTEDESVPDFDARVVADAHASAELRILPGASHQLRHDPRAIAMLLGWLDRQRHAAPVA
jgi:putative redox protein